MGLNIIVPTYFKFFSVMSILYGKGMSSENIFEKSASEHSYNRWKQDAEIYYEKMNEVNKIIFGKNVRITILIGSKSFGYMGHTNITAISYEEFIRTQDNILESLTY